MSFLTIETLLEKEYPVFFKVYIAKELDDKIKDIIKLRNIPKIKTELEQVMKKIDREKSMGYKETLSNFATKNAKSARPPMTKNHLLTKLQKRGYTTIKQLFDLKVENSEDASSLREVFKDMMENDGNIPKAIKEEFAKTGLTEEMFWAFINYDSVRFFAIDFYNGDI